MRLPCQYAILPASDTTDTGIIPHKTSIDSYRKLEQSRYVTNYFRGDSESFRLPIPSPRLGNLKWRGRDRVPAVTVGHCHSDRDHATRSSVPVHHDSDVPSCARRRPWHRLGTCGISESESLRLPRAGHSDWTRTQKFRVRVRPAASQTR
jgi:hypothetical protein